MERLSTMNMEEIAPEIAKDSLNLGEFADRAENPQDSETEQENRTGADPETEGNVDDSTDLEADSTEMSEEMKESSTAVESVSEPEAWQNQRLSRKPKRKSVRAA